MQSPTFRTGHAAARQCLRARPLLVGVVGRPENASVDRGRSRRPSGTHSLVGNDGQRICLCGGYGTRRRSRRHAADAGGTCVQYRQWNGDALFRGGRDRAGPFSDSCFRSSARTAATIEIGTARHYARQANSRLGADVHAARRLRGLRRRTTRRTHSNLRSFDR